MSFDMLHLELLVASRFCNLQQRLVAAIEGAHIYSVPVASADYNLTFMWDGPSAFFSHIISMI